MVGQVGQPCRACTHPEVDAINAAMLAPDHCFTDIAKRYGIGSSSLYRHYNGHIAELVKSSLELRQMLSAENLLAMLNRWHERLEEQYQKANDLDNIAAAVATARAGIQAIEAYSRIGEAVALRRVVARHPY